MNIIKSIKRLQFLGLIFGFLIKAVAAAAPLQTSTLKPGTDLKIRVPSEDFRFEIGIGLPNVTEMRFKYQLGETYFVGGSVGYFPGTIFIPTEAKKVKNHFSDRFDSIMTNQLNLTSSSLFYQKKLSKHYFWENQINLLDYWLLVFILWPVRLWAVGPGPATFSAKPLNSGHYEIQSITSFSQSESSHPLLPNQHLRLMMGLNERLDIGFEIDSLGSTMNLAFLLVSSSNQRWNLASVFSRTTIGTSTLQCIGFTLSYTTGIVEPFLSLRYTMAEINPSDFDFKTLPERSDPSTAMMGGEFGLRTWITKNFSLGLTLQNPKFIVGGDSTILQEPLHLMTTYRF